MSNLRLAQKPNATAKSAQPAQNRARRTPRAVSRLISRPPRFITDHDFCLGQPGTPSAPIRIDVPLLNLWIRYAQALDEFPAALLCKLLCGMIDVPSEDLIELGRETEAALGL